MTWNDDELGTGTGSTPLPQARSSSSDAVEATELIGKPLVPTTRKSVLFPDGNPEATEIGKPYQQYSRSEHEARLAQRRERARGWVAFVLLIYFGVVLLAPFVGVLLLNVPLDTVKDLWGIALPAVTSLVGTAVGFYFGSRDRAGGSIGREGR